VTDTVRGWLTPRVVRWLPVVAAALTVAVFAGFAVRPLLQTVAGETNPTSIAYVAELQKIAHLHVNGHRQYYEDSLYWVIWYIGVPAVLLGAFGLAVLARRCLRALLAWKDPDSTARIWALPLMMAIWVVVTVLWRPAVSPDQPWASRRLVPFVLPGLILGAIWASAWLKDRAERKGRKDRIEDRSGSKDRSASKDQAASKDRAGSKDRLGRNRATSAAVGCCCVASLIIPTALTTLDLHVIKNPQARVSVRGMAFRKIGAGELTAVRGLCAAIGPGASVVILDSLTADRFAQVVRGICDTPAAVLDAPAPGDVQAVMDGIRLAGRRPVLLAGQQPELASSGGTPREVVNLLTTQEAHNLTTPPSRTWLIHYTVWMSEPTRAPGAPGA
jgi:hypothetical protein